VKYQLPTYETNLASLGSRNNLIVETMTDLKFGALKQKQHYYARKYVPPISWHFAVTFSLRSLGIESAAL
jgi:hypothetical protein